MTATIIFIITTLICLAWLIWLLTDQFDIIIMIPIFLGCISMVFLVTSLVYGIPSTCTLNDFTLDKTSRDVIIYVDNERIILSDVYSYNNSDNITGVVKITRKTLLENKKSISYDVTFEPPKK